MKVYHMTADGVLVVDYRKLVRSASFQHSLATAHRIMEHQRRRDTQPQRGQEGGDGE